MSGWRSLWLVALLAVQPLGGAYASDDTEKLGDVLRVTRPAAAFLSGHAATAFQGAAFIHPRSGQASPAYAAAVSVGADSNEFRLRFAMRF